MKPTKKLYEMPTDLTDEQKAAWAALGNDSMRGQFIRDHNARRMSAQKKEAEPKKPREPKVDATLTRKVRVLAEKNPKREGSASHARFALYATGETVEAYIVACVEAKQQRRAARADIDWDVKHKFIELTD